MIAVPAPFDAYPKSALWLTDELKKLKTLGY